MGGAGGELGAGYIVYPFSCFDSCSSDVKPKTQTRVVTCRAVSCRDVSCVCVCVCVCVALVLGLAIGYGMGDARLGLGGACWRLGKPMPAYPLGRGICRKSLAGV